MTETNRMRGWGWTIALFSAALAVGTVRASVFDVVRIADEGMAPRLREGDHTLAYKLAYGLQAPYVGELVGWAEPAVDDLVLWAEQDRLRVGRVVATAGETVETDGAQLVVDGAPRFLLGESSKTAHLHWDMDCKPASDVLELHDVGSHQRFVDPTTVGRMPATLPTEVPADNVAVSIDHAGIAVQMWEDEEEPWVRMVPRTALRGRLFRVAYSTDPCINDGRAERRWLPLR